MRGTLRVGSGWCVRTELRPRVETLLTFVFLSLSLLSVAWLLLNSLEIVVEPVTYFLMLVPASSEDKSKLHNHNVRQFPVTLEESYTSWTVSAGAPLQKVLLERLIKHCNHPWRMAGRAVLAHR